MKKRTFLKGFSMLLMLALIVSACKKEDETPSFEEMAFDGEEVLAKLPDGLKGSSDEKANECVDLIEDALDMSAFMENMVPPEDAQLSAKKGSVETWSWTWSYMGESFTFFWSYEEDNSKRYWTMDIQYNNGPVYDYIDAWEALDGTEGEVVYNFNWVVIGEEDLTDYEELQWRYTWSLDGDGAYHFNWYYDSADPEYTYYLHSDIVINADGSGTIDYYLADALFYHMEWDALGNGSWAYYMGEMSMTGTWTVSK